MKLTFKPAPNYRAPQSTSGIMRDLTYCLLAVTLFSVIYYSAFHGAYYGLRVVVHMISSLAGALAAEAIWFKAVKKDVKEGILTSYGWITAMILALISSISVSYYALFVSSAIAVIFGKLVFGGFGQNIFNPAAFGEAILLNTFAGANRTDLISGATPTAAIGRYGWLMPKEMLSEFVAGYGGYGRLVFGLYPSSLGSTAAIIILICMVYLIYKQDVDWQAPVFYIGTVFVLTLIIGLAKGAGIGYAFLNLLIGGVLFGGVFMTTDPVTSPVTIPGRIVFAVSAAVLTVIFRLKANMADGVLYSILLLNMLTPAIDKLMDGNQIKDAAVIRRRVILVCAIMVMIGLCVGLSSSGQIPETAVTAAAYGRI